MKISDKSPKHFRKWRKGVCGNACVYLAVGTLVEDRVGRPELGLKAADEAHDVPQWVCDVCKVECVYSTPYKQVITSICKVECVYSTPYK